MSQMRTDMTQMQVAAATGQPLLAPAPLQQFIYPQAMNPSYQPMHLRMYDSSPQIQYLPPNPHQSQTPSPAQPPQYNPGAQVAPQAPPQQCQGAPPPQAPPQFPIVYPLLPGQPHMMQSMQYLQQAPPPPQHPMQMLMHPAQGTPHGPNP